MGDQGRIPSETCPELLQMSRISFPLSSFLKYIFCIYRFRYFHILPTEDICPYKMLILPFIFSKTFHFQRRREYINPGEGIAFSLHAELVADQGFTHLLSKEPLRRYLHGQLNNSTNYWPCKYSPADGCQMRSTVMNSRSSQALLKMWNFFKHVQNKKISYFPKRKSSIYFRSTFSTS